MGRLPKNPKMILAVIQGETYDLSSSAVSVLRELGKKFQFSILFKPCFMEESEEQSGILGQDALKTILSCDATLYGKVSRHWYEYRKHPLSMLANAVGATCAMRHIYLFPALRELSFIKRELLIPYVDAMLISERPTDVIMQEERVSSSRNLETVEEVLTFAMNIAQKRKGRIVNLTSSIKEERSTIWNSYFARNAVKRPELRCENVDLHELFYYISDTDVLVCEFDKTDTALELVQMVCGRGDMMPVGYMSQNYSGIFTSHIATRPYVFPTAQMNPIGMLLSVAMMLEMVFHMQKEALWLKRAIAMALEDGYRTQDIFTEGCRLVDMEEMTAVICEKIQTPIRHRKKNKEKN